MPKGQYDRSVPRRSDPDEVVADGDRLVRLTEAFGFVNEYDARYFKPQGAVISNPIEIRVLRERGAPIEEV